MALGETEISAIVGFLGAVIGAGSTWWAAISVAKWTRTMELHREFNSERLSKARSEAAVLLERHHGKSFLEISETDAEAVPLWEVVYFYERLWTLVRYRQVVLRAVPDLFGEIFLWWYFAAFKQQLIPANWKSSADIESLYLWLQSRTNAKQWSEWVAKQTTACNALRSRQSTVARLAQEEQ